MHEQCGAWTAPLREQGTTAPKDGSAHCAKSCAWREGLWVGHGRAGDGLMSAFPASCCTQGTSRRMCAAVGVGGGALVQPPQPLCVKQHPFCQCRVRGGLPRVQQHNRHRERAGGRELTCKHTAAWQRQQTWNLHVYSGEDHSGRRETRGGG